jgi:hypothetical protein
VTAAVLLDPLGRELDQLETDARELLLRFQLLTGEKGASPSRWSHLPHAWEAARKLVALHDAVRTARHRHNAGCLLRQDLAIVAEYAGHTVRAVESAERAIAKCVYCKRVVDSWAFDDGGEPRCTECGVPERDHGHDFGATEPAEEGR